MPAAGRKDLLARRRRRPDEGEDEESVAGDFDDSMSEGSSVSNGDEEAEVEGSGSSDDEHGRAKNTSAKGRGVTESALQEIAIAPPKEAASTVKGAFTTTAETHAMLHGISRDQRPEETEEIHFDDLSTVGGSATDTDVAIPQAPRHETPAERSLREHQEYIRQRNADPAFVPNRGKFFLHDDRNSSSNGATARPFVLGRGRGHGPSMNPGRGVASNEPTERPWAHDLHEGHEKGQSSEPPRTQPVAASQTSQNENPRGPTAPNRLFSFTTVLGNVAIQISFPGMDQKKSVPNVVKKQHTLLPQHRPPLRRDKPVRVSLPSEPPRYIFPSTERSFIFIPRAMRPNKQAYFRGRGRGSFHGSRRPSIYGSAYTPSIAMSRKSSIGASTMRDDIRSPAESVMSRVAGPGMDPTRPIVRMPLGVPTPSISRTGAPLVHGQMGPNIFPANIQTPAFYGSYSTTIPMHQPIPQKTVSVADIESPASFPVKAPLQQQEQPFHQQVPGHYGEDKSSQPAEQILPALAGTTPLSQIPEGAVFGQGYPSYPVMSGPAFFGGPYQNGPVFYQGAADSSSFAAPMTGPGLAPSFIPGSQSHPVNYMHGPGRMEGSIADNMMAHESNGMVYYYNPPMYTPEARGGVQQYPFTNGNVMTMPNGTTSQPFYYSGVPNGMFYPAQTG
ncbi:hypothetical protein LTR67_004520 [Exophiala xenobiotica]